MGGAKGKVIVCDVVLERGGYVAGEEYVEGHLPGGLQLRLHAEERHVQSVVNQQLADAVR